MGKQEVVDFRHEEEAKREAAELEEKLKGFSDAASKNAKSVLARMNGNNAAALLSNAFTGWSTGIQEEKKQREMEEKVKEAEQRFAEFQARQKDGAKGVLGGMQASSEQGLIAMCFNGWKTSVQEEKEQMRLQEAMAEKAAAMNQFGAKGKMTAKSELERMKRYGQAKNNARKQQLHNVKGLFKNFAGELEQGLKEGTPRVDMKAMKNR